MELALDNIAMETSLKLQAQRSKMLSHRLIDIQESERKRIARDLHDDTGQALTVLKVSLETARKDLSEVANDTQERLDDAVALTDETLVKTANDCPRPSPAHPRYHRVERDAGTVLPGLCPTNAGSGHL